MDPLIENLKSTTFFGKRFTRKQLADIQITVGRFPKLSRAELGRTICEHLRWRTPGGRDRLKSALGLLEELERLGILSLPPKRHRGRGRQKPVELTSRTAPRSLIDGPLAGLAPLQLEPVTKPEAVAEWNEWVQRHHPLGYRQPLGTHLRYFLLDGEKRQLGCLLFDFAARNVRCRDQWIGWPVGQHHRHLNLVVRNARFVLFPWVQVKCLASQALGLALRQLPRRRLDSCRPSLGPRQARCPQSARPPLQRHPRPAPPPPAGAPSPVASQACPVPRPSRTLATCRLPCNECIGMVRGRARPPALLEVVRGLPGASAGELQAVRGSIQVQRAGPRLLVQAFQQRTLNSGARAGRKRTLWMSGR